MKPHGHLVREKKSKIGDIIPHNRNTHKLRKVGHSDLVFTNLGMDHQMHPHTIYEVNLSSTFIDEVVHALSLMRHLISRKYSDLIFCKLGEGPPDCSPLPI